MDDRGFFRRRGLILPAVLAPAIETVLLAALGLHGALSLAPQVTAPTPLDIFHDLRWVAVYHNSWPILALEIVGVLALRSLWVAWVVQRSWPDDAPPPMGRASLRSVLFLIVAALLLVPFVILLFGLALTHLSFLFFAALPPVIAIALIIHGGAIRQAAGRWWRWRPTASGLGWILASFVWLTLAGSVMRSVPLPVAVLIAAATGLANARAWFGLVQSLQRRPKRRRVRALVPVTVGVTFAVVVGGAAIGFAVTTGGNRQPLSAPPPAPEAQPGERPVLVAAGLYSRLVPEPPIPLPQGFEAWRFSYLGVDDKGRPIPYGPSDTIQSLYASAEQMSEQVEKLAEAYGQPVTIVAESAGALVARTYLTQLAPAPGVVDRFVTLSVHPGPSTVYFPEQGRQGWGVGSGWMMRGLVGIIDEMAPFEATVDAPIMRDLVDCRNLLHDVVSDPVGPGIREVAIDALADFVDRPLSRSDDVAVQVVTAPHAGLLGRDGVQAVIGDLLTGSGEELQSVGGTLGSFVSAISSPWRVPDLDQGLFPSTRCPNN